MPSDVTVEVISSSSSVVEVPGPGMGPPGPPGQWMQMTQAAYDALPVKDPNTLYVIIG